MTRAKARRRAKGQAAPDLPATIRLGDVLYLSSAPRGEPKVMITHTLLAFVWEKQPDGSWRRFAEQRVSFEDYWPVEDGSKTIDLHPDKWKLVSPKGPTEP